MRQIQRIFIVCIFVSSFVFGISTSADAQAMSSYVYLEVVDANQKPVPAANITPKTRGSQGSVLETDSEGKAHISDLYMGGESLILKFTINEPGYFFFQDFGGLQNTYQRSVKIELLKIPKTKSERKTLGDEQKKRELFWAIQNGDVKSVSKLIESGISPNLTIGDLRGISGYEKVPAIIYPAVTGDGAMIKTLLKTGADVRRKDEYISNILFYYLAANVTRNRQFVNDEKTKILQEYDQGLKALVKAGADVNANQSGAYMSFPIMKAIEQRQINAVKILIESGANVNAKNIEGKTPLTIAKQYLGYSSSPEKSGYEEIIKILETAGAK